MSSLATSACRFFHFPARQLSSTAAGAGASTSTGTSFAEMADKLSGLTATIQDTRNRAWSQPYDNPNHSEMHADKHQASPAVMHHRVGSPAAANPAHHRSLHTQQQSTTASKEADPIRPLHMNHNQQADPQFKVNVISNVPQTTYTSALKQHQPQPRVNVISDVPRSAYSTMRNLKAARRSMTGPKIKGSNFVQFATKHNA